MQNYYSYVNFSIAFLCFFTNVSAQVIKGSVTDINKNSLSAKILIKPLNNPNLISEFVITSNGSFSYNLKKEYPMGFIIEVKSTGFKEAKEEIKDNDSSKPLLFEFILIKEKIEKLEEVIIKGKKKPFIRKKDTIVFRVDSYKDGTERKVEDLLKRLPGVEVDDKNGTVKYKGKSIETVTLEGDNLFDSNYTIGTKNINIDLVKEIEAIENYSENKLLKGIENSDKIILNLKLKDNKTDFSGSANVGVGDFSGSKEVASNNVVNLLGINKKIKSFSLATHNNIGVNPSPFNYFGNSFSAEQLREQDIFAKKIIPETILPQFANNNLSNINNQFFGNFNSTFNLSSKIKTRVNLFYITDKIKNNEFSESTITINDEQFSIFDDIFIQKKPRQYRGDVELKVNTSKNALLEYNVSYRNETIDTENSIFSNQGNNFSSNLGTKNQLIKQDVEFTKRISKDKALQFRLRNTINNLDQNFNISPSIFNNSEFINDVQKNASNKVLTSFNVILLGKKNKSKYNFVFGGNLDRESLQTNLFSQNDAVESSISNGFNDIKYRKNDFFSSGSYNWRLGRFFISPKYTLRFLNQNLEFIDNNTFDELSRIIFEPSISVLYYINDTSFLTLGSFISQSPNTVENLFTNQVITNNRLSKNNIPSLRLRKNQTYNLSYNNNDLSNQLNLSIGANYTITDGNFFNNTQIDEFNTITTNFFLSENTSNVNLYFNFSKLIYPIKTNIKINSSYSVLNFKNIINNSDLRDNRSTFLNNSIFLKTAFNLPVNIENTITHLYNINESQGIFENQSIENKLKLLIKPSKQFFVNIIYNLFVPDINSSNSFSFLESQLNYQPKNKNWQLSLSGINLLNERFFEQISTTDFSISRNRFNLLNRYILFNFNYSF
ncbi:outer membrane beta-barrel family protein [Winogradskyella immobilis]|uniref:Uncharacterized protein n=1 Tax=Winogradskyella immobilis TaxID=2816852 RepID=A0ABS8EQ09_9FLAO|nr:outer membrane beta-barrel family protein [Winogradskyella immobilis]MCC1485319.1 hypothetical protein [Winogradskyella immobilis]MCG0017411.1 outer membrane beta-barrel family protein [Winogradskyella immobilis]